MKKVLLATSALVAFAGAAAAEVSLSGDARMGVVYDGGTEKFAFTNRARVTFSLSGESDVGVSFGGSFKAHESGSDNDAAELGADNGVLGEVFIKGDFGTFTMGSTATGLEKRVGEVSGVGLTGLGDRNEIVGESSDEPIARYDYDMAGFGISLSGDKELDDYSVGVSYTADLGGSSAGIALGYDHDEQTDTDYIGVGLTGSFAGADVKLAYVADTDATDEGKVAVSLGYGLDAIGVTAFAKHDLMTENTDFGLGVSYDLGGGLSAKAGVVQDGTTEDMHADFGLSMSF